MPSRKEGILYIATNDEYLEDAKKAAKITAKHIEKPIAVVTHRELENNQIFDEVIIDDSPNDDFSDKPRNIGKTPFEKTIYLDADAYVVDDISEIFELLDNFHLCAAIDPNELDLRLSDHENRVQEEIPEAFPENNTGVIGFRKSKCSEFFDKWNESQKTVKFDQASFRYALYNSDIRFTSLNSNYNCLIGFPMQVTGEVKIIHDLYDAKEDIGEDIISRVNASMEPRILYFNRGEIYSIEYGPERLVMKTAAIAKYAGQFQRSLSKYGVLSTMFRSVKKVVRILF